MLGPIKGDCPPMTQACGTALGWWQVKEGKKVFFQLALSMQVYTDVSALLGALRFFQPCSNPWPRSDGDFWSCLTCLEAGG